MKIAFVNQPIDAILPPIQTSIGACTYGVARALARDCDVVVYGGRDIDAHQQAGSIFYNEGVDYRFVSAAPDQVIVKLFKRFSRLFEIKEPISSSRWFYPGYALKVAMDLRQQQSHIVHIQHSSQIAPIIRALNPKVKIVLHLHAELFPQSNWAKLERNLRQVDLVLSVSDYVTKKTRRAFPQFASRCQTVYNGIEAKEFVREKNPSIAKKGAVKQLMYAGAVSPHKGLHVLLDAFQIVVQRYPQVQLDIVGPHWSYPLQEVIALNDKPMVDYLAPFYSSNYISYLKNKLSEDVVNKVSFAGAVPRSELLNHYLNADVFIFPSVWDEGFGIPPVEAMAAGVPVVATRSGAVVETVQDGKTGLLVEKRMRLH